MRNRMYGGVRGRKTKVGRKLLRFPPTRLPLIRSALNEFIDSTRSLFNENKTEDENHTLLRGKINEILASFNELSEDCKTYIVARDKIKELNDMIYHYRSLSEKRDYSINNLKRKADRLLMLLNNQWITFKSKSVWSIAGAAGTEKSHLIGDVVRKRQRNNEPSILLLGDKFTTQDDPLTQIMALLDLPGKKEEWLKNLNNYGKHQNKPVTIFIDGINEKGGESLWSAHIVGLIDDIERYDYLRLVVSFRISGAHNWFYDMAYNHPEYSVYHHKGFEGKEELASEFIFGSYGLDQPLWPTYGSEFANPLFLIKYCKVHEGKSLPLEYEGFWNIIIQYCNEMNHDLSLRFHYDESLHLVTNALRAIAVLMVEKTGRWYLEYGKAIETLTEVAKYTKCPHEFLRMLIDDGILGIETYKGIDYVNFGFERVGDFFVAECLINKGMTDLDDFYKYGSYTNEAIAVLAPEITGKEFFELVSSNHKGFAFRSFLASASQRDVFTEKGRSVINKLFNSGHESDVIDMIIRRPFRSDKYANSDALYDYLWRMSLCERDAKWTVGISEAWGNGRQLEDLALWAMNASDKTLACVRIESMRLCSEILVWAFSSTWRELRDRATHALTKILSVRTELTLPLLVKFYGINDPYIEERLWASVMGCVVSSQDENMVKGIAEWIYLNLFEKGNVPLHILVRDYALSIIRYAQSLDVELVVDEGKMSLPLSNAKLPEKILTSEEIKAKYDKEWDNVKDDEDERELYIARHSILSSMATEYSPRGMYGDFGRYVFQANMHEIPVDPEEMSNWAIEMIFDEFGYDPKLFANFDIHLESSQNFGYRVERIGKKYQWIAMYRIMAVLEDVYKDIDLKRRWTTLVQSARNIDPTFKFVNKELMSEHSIYDVPTFDVTLPKSDVKWMKSWKKMPPINDYLHVVDKDGVEWLNLYSHNTIKTVRDALSKSYMQRDLWTFVQAFVVKTTDLDTVCSNIHKHGLEGRDFRENREISGLYAREFFWSDEYKKSITEDDYGFAPFHIGNRWFDDVHIAPAYLIYSYSSSDDASLKEGFWMLYPNAWLFKGLNLKYAKENGAWVDDNDEIVLVDNRHFGKGYEALLIRKDIMLDYLNREGLTLFWPILTERQINCGSWAKHEQNGGWAYMDQKGIIHHKFRVYAKSEWEKKLDSINEKWLKLWIPIKNETLLWLHRKRIIRLSEEKLWRLMGLGPSYIYDEDSPWNMRGYRKILQQLKKEGKIVDNDNSILEDSEDVDDDNKIYHDLNAQWNDEEEE